MALTTRITTFPRHTKQIRHISQRVAATWDRWRDVLFRRMKDKGWRSGGEVSSVDGAISSALSK